MNIDSKPNLVVYVFILAHVSAPSVYIPGILKRALISVVLFVFIFQHIIIPAVV